jgi:hypothetical protein
LYTHGLDREVLEGPVVTNHRLVANALDEGTPHPRVEWRDEPQPQAAEARREHRNRDHEAAQPPLSCVFAHEFAVRNALGSTDLVDATLLRLEVQGGLEICKEITDCDGLRLHTNPSRCHHHGKPLDERAEHLEGEAARSDDDRGSEFDHWHTGGAQDASHLVATAKMRGEFPFLVAQAAQVHDAAHAGSARRAREVLRTQAIPLLEALRTRTAHGVHHVVRGVHSF